MKDQASVSTVYILDKEYRVSSTLEKQEALHAAARYLNAKMQEIRATGKVIGIERIAVMAALNLSYELMQNRQQSENELHEAHEQIDEVVNRINRQIAEIE